MRTNIVIDEALMKQALELTGARWWNPASGPSSA